MRAKRETRGNGASRSEGNVRAVRKGPLIAAGIAVLGFAGSYVVHIVGSQRSDTELRELYATAGLHDGRYTYTYAASDDSGMPIIVGDGVLTLDGRACTASGRVYVGQTPANPNSAPQDIHATLDEAESVGVGRNGVIDGVESVLLPNGTNGGAVPAPWLDDTDVSRSFCMRVLHQLEFRQPYTPITGTDTVSSALLAEDAARDLVRLTGRGLTAHQDPFAQTRTELVVGNGMTSIVTRLVVDDAPTIVVSQVNLQPYKANTGGTAR
jgi:hypothetical protein